MVQRFLSFGRDCDSTMILTMMLKLFFEFLAAKLSFLKTVTAIFIWRIFPCIKPVMKRKVRNAFSKGLRRISAIIRLLHMEALDSDIQESVVLVKTQGLVTWSPLSMKANILWITHVCNVQDNLIVYYIFQLSIFCFSETQTGW